MEATLHSSSLGDSALADITPTDLAQAEPPTTDESNPLNAPFVRSLLESIVWDSSSAQDHLDIRQLGPAYVVGFTDEQGYQRVFFFGTDGEPLPEEEWTTPNLNEYVIDAERVDALPPEDKAALSSLIEAAWRESGSVPLDGRESAIAAAREQLSQSNPDRIQVERANLFEAALGGQDSTSFQTEGGSIISISRQASGRITVTTEDGAGTSLSYEFLRREVPGYGDGYSYIRGDGDIEPVQAAIAAHLAATPPPMP